MSRSISVPVSIVAVHQPPGGSTDPDTGRTYRKKLLARVDRDSPEAGMAAGEMWAILDAQTLHRLPAPFTGEDLERLAAEAGDGSWTLLHEDPIRHDIKVAAADPSTGDGVG